MLYSGGSHQSLERHSCLREAFSSTAAGDFVGSSSRNVWLMNGTTIFRQALKASFIWSLDRPKLNRKRRAPCNYRSLLLAH